MTEVIEARIDALECELAKGKRAKFRESAKRGSE